jgi:membrane protein required for colicin V production
MSYIDIIICCALAWGAFKGFQKGFLFEIAIFFALIAACYCGFRFSGFAAGYLQKKFEISSSTLPFLSFLTVFILVVAGIIAFAKMLELLLKAVALNLFNKLAGAALGLAKWALIISLLFYFLIPFDNKYKLISEKAKENSFLYKPISGFSLFIIPVLKEYQSRLDFSKISSVK